jgi:hypothetical protein
MDFSLFLHSVIEIKWPERETNQLTHAKGNFKNEWSCTSINSDNLNFNGIKPVSHNLTGKQKSIEFQT